MGKLGKPGKIGKSGKPGNSGKSENSGKTKSMTSQTENAKLKKRRVAVSRSVLNNRSALVASNRDSL